jgi:hypothetical protein
MASTSNREATTERKMVVPRTIEAPRAFFKSRVPRDEVVEKYGAVEGGKQALGRLAGYAATLPAGGL